MITKHTKRYVSIYKASPYRKLPVARVTTEYTLTKIHFDSVEKFNLAVSFLDRRSHKIGRHPIRQKYFPIGSFNKIHVDRRNLKVYLVKQTYKKRHDIIV